MAFLQTKFGSESQEWETPDEIFIPLLAEFGIERDVCATMINAKVTRFWNKEINALKQEWRGVCWMNPPFRDLVKWVKKAFSESQRNGATVVCLIPARTNTEWWHNYVMKGEIRFIRGRPKFKGCKHGLPQPLAIVIFHGVTCPQMSELDYGKDLLQKVRP